MRSYSRCVGRILTVAVLYAGMTYAVPLYAGRGKITDTEPFYVYGGVFDSGGVEVPGALVYYIADSDTLTGKTDRSGQYWIAVPFFSSVYGQDLPAPFSLGQNSPNPFNPSTVIQFECSEAADVLMEVFNVLGQRVMTLVDGHYPAGRHAVTWNGTDDSGASLSAGVYLYRLTAGPFRATRKMLLLDGGRGLVPPKMSPVSDHVSKISAPPDETVYYVVCEKRGVGSVRERVTAVFDGGSYRHDITLPGIYEPPPYAKMEGLEYAIWKRDDNNELELLWTGSFDYGDFHASVNGLGTEKGVYRIDGNTITITITDSALVERNGMTFEVTYSAISEGENVIEIISFTNAIRLTMGVAQDDIVTITLKPV